LDIFVIGVYVPPKPLAARKLKVWKKTVSLILEWVCEMLDIIPARATVFLVGDFNDAFAQCEDSDYKSVLGIYPQTIYQGHVASQLLDICYQHYLMVATTFYRIEPTFYGSVPSAESNPDHIMLPQSCKDDIESLLVYKTSGRKLQLIPDNRPRDHYPLVLKLSYRLKVAIPSPVLTWNHNKIAACLQFGVGREAYLKDLELAFWNKNIAQTHSSGIVVDGHWAAIIAVLKEVGQKHFQGQKKDVDPAYRDLMDLKPSLLRKLGALRHSSTGVHNSQLEQYKKSIKVPVKINEMRNLEGNVNKN